MKVKKIDKAMIAKHYVSFKRLVQNLNVESLRFKAFWQLPSTSFKVHGTRVRIIKANSAGITKIYLR